MLFTYGYDLDMNEFRGQYINYRSFLIFFRIFAALIPCQTSVPSAKQKTYRPSGWKWDHTNFIHFRG